MLSQRNIYLLKKKNTVLANTYGHQSTIFGFRHSRHAQYIRQKIGKFEFRIRRDTYGYILNLEQKRSYPINEFYDISESAESYVAFLAKLNSVKFLIVSDLIIEERAIKLLSEECDEEIEINYDMIKGNLEKIYTNGVSPI